MNSLVNDPATFVAESLAAFSAANTDRVIQVGSGVVRRTMEPGKVSIILGGGAGHFPAFIGWVGRGFGSAAVTGNIFASPSEHQIFEVARHANQGAGIIFIPINYAGDILHFTGASERLKREGIDVRLRAVTDDIASGPPDHRELRRGIAGSFIVMKIAGAAAERGYSLDAVDLIAKTANDATRSFGVAFSGCTLPGQDTPLFTVPEGRIAIGLGIHGEPGIAERASGSASEVADLIVDGLFAERAPQAGQAVAALVNGLGATKYDELNVVFGRVRDRLEDKRMRLVAPVVGEYVTSLSMAGLSVSVAYLDPELEDLWRDSVDSVSFSRSRFPPHLASQVPMSSQREGVAPPIAGSRASRAASLLLVNALENATAAVESAKESLGDIDSVDGDGDHGIGMSTGIHAALIAAQSADYAGAGVGTVLRSAGEQWSNVAGGTSGALWGSGLIAAGAVLGDSDPVTASSVSRAVLAFQDAILSRGGAVIGDKTMVDAIVPFATTLNTEIEAGASLFDAWRRAAFSATRAAESTAGLTPRLGRARIHADRSIGSPDAGAVSFALIAEAALGHGRFRFP